MEGTSYRITSLYSDSNKKYYVPQINFSLGLEIEIINSFKLVFDGKMIRCFDGPLYFPLSASIKFGL